jgi:beta-1,4-mannosyltransferase
MAALINYVLQAIWGLVFIWIVRTALKSKPSYAPSLGTAVVLVLGDVGRSPRMMYHAESFAKNGFATVVVGYEGKLHYRNLLQQGLITYIGAKPIPSLLSEPLVLFKYIPQLPGSFGSLPFILLAPLKIVFQITALLITLFIRIPNPPEFIIVQVCLYQS